MDKQKYLDVESLSKLMNIFNSELNHNHAFKIYEHVASTCTENGYIVYKCNCGETMKKILAKGHHYVNYKCTMCGEYDPKHGHNYTAWEIVKNPSYAEDGLQQRTCLECGYVEQIIIDKLT